VLGLDLSGTDDLPAHLAALLAEREEARTGKNFARADEIRDRLRAEGIEVLDSSEGTRWVKR
jgi:cysteinyl-tRNA synthetase